MLFRVLSPALELSLLLALLCNWRPVAATRWRLAAALALAIVSDVITFAFHYPRNTILFSAPLTATPADLDRVATEWAMGNYVPIAVVLTTVILVIASLVRISRDTLFELNGRLNRGSPSIPVRLMLVAKNHLN
jgi:hypothetical protein